MLRSDLSLRWSHLGVATVPGFKSLLWMKKLMRVSEVAFSDARWVTLVPMFKSERKEKRRKGDFTYRPTDNTTMAMQSTGMAWLRVYYVNVGRTKATTRPGIMFAPSQSGPGASASSLLSKAQTRTRRPLDTITQRRFEHTESPTDPSWAFLDTVQ